MKKSAVKVKETPEISLAEITQRILTGHLDKMPGKVNLDLSNASAADYQALLELVRYRSFGHQVLNTQPTLSDLQNVRALIHKGDFDKALKSVEVLNKDDAEVRIEKARALGFQGKFSDVPILLEAVFADKSVSAHHRGVAAQILGHAHLELGQLTQANLAIESALTLALGAGNTLGCISAYLFLSRIRIFTNDFEKGEYFLEKAFIHVRKEGSFRWFLGYYRHLSQFSFFSGNNRCISEAHAAVLIARSLKDKVFEYRGVLEIVLMARKFGMDLMLNGLREEIEAFARQSDSDVKHWANSVLNGAPAHTYTAERFLQVSGNPVNHLSMKLDPNLSNSPVWFFDRGHNLLVDLESAEVSRLPGDGPLGKMLIALNQADSKISTSDLFEKVWKLRWCGEKHQNVLDVNLHRLNKILKNASIERDDNGLHLSHKGLVF